jgi:class 3 adenylate cyclase
LRLPILAVLLAAFGGLTIATTAIVGMAFYIAALRNTVELVGDIGEVKLLRIEDALVGQLRPAAEQSAYLAEFIGQNNIASQSDRRLRDLLLGSLAAIPQLEAVAFIAPNYKAVWATNRAETGEHFSQVIDVSGLAGMRQILAQARDRGYPSWSAPMVIEDGPRDAMVVAITPVMRDGVFIGAVAAGVSLRGASSAMSKALGSSGSDYFVMTATGRIVFHGGLSLWPAPLPGQAALPDLASFADPILRAMPWPPGAARDTISDPDDPRSTVDFEIVDFLAGDTEQFVVYKLVRGYGQTPWVIGFHMARWRVQEFATTLNRAIPFALVMLAISLLISFWLGRAISRPIRDLAAQSLRIAELQFEDRPESKSMLREIWQAAQAQRQMTNGLKWLSHYMPQSLVPALMRSHGALRSREADVVVLFSDIVGFSRIAEGRRADRVAALLNRHFSMLGQCIEAEVGTIDKYIGDSVMAFWGAPAEQEDRAERAQRAAAAIARRIGADNKRRIKKGLQPIRIRIGLHRGPAVVGNIGAPGRINYTLIGDTVNIAQRLEQLGSELDDGTADAIVIASKETILRPPLGIAWSALGKRVLSGRSTETEVFQMRLG